MHPNFDTLNTHQQTKTIYDVIVDYYVSKWLHYKLFPVTDCKIHWNLLRFAKVIDRSLLARFYGPQCSHSTAGGGVCMRFVCVRCSCIDEWFKVSRSCPEHPGDWASVSSAATVHRSWIAGFFLELCSRWPAGCVLTGVSSAACRARWGTEGEGRVMWATNWTFVLLHVSRESVDDDDA